MKTINILLLTVFFTSACSNIRVRYNSQLKLNDGRTGTYLYEKSYKVSGFNVWGCVITGILYGGLCWTYLGLPSSTHKEQLDQDAHDHLASLIKVPYQEEEVIIQRVNWNGDPEIEASLDGITATPVATPTPEPIIKSSSPPPAAVENAPGFLR